MKKWNLLVLLMLVMVGFVACSREKTPSADGAENEINGHEYVDLGLSVKWATCNVGASSPADDGNYYAWGETQIKSDYSEGNSITWRKTMGDIGGDPQHDVARASWGGSWRLPMRSEFAELVEECRWVWTTMYGHNGYEIVGPNGNSIFLPAAGYRTGSSLNRAGSHGNYWSSTPYESDTDFAYGLSFDSDSHFVGWGYRDYGFSVRPVSE